MDQELGIALQQLNAAQLLMSRAWRCWRHGHGSVLRVQTFHLPATDGSMANHKIWNRRHGIVAKLKIKAGEETDGSAKLGFGRNRTDDGKHQRAVEETCSFREQTDSRTAEWHPTS